MTAPDPLDAMVSRLRKVPQQTRSRDKVARVLAAADRLLASHGAEALTTTRVAAAAGVSVGTLYQYFANKEAILVAMARRVLNIAAEPLWGSYPARSWDTTPRRSVPLAPAYADGPLHDCGPHVRLRVG